MMLGKVIDADGHILEPPDLWARYLENKYKDRAIRMEKDQQGVEYFIIDGRPSANLRGIGPAAAGIGQPYQEIATSGTFSYFDGPKGAYDPSARLRLMDEEGLDVAVLFPSLGLTWEVEVKDAELAAAYARAYNNWIIDFCTTDPKRLIPVAHISLLDINEGVKEVQRVAKLGVKGAFMRAAPPSQIPYWDHAYDPFWAVLQEANMPIGFHVSLNEYFLGHQWKMSESVTAVQSPLHGYRFSVVMFDVQAAFAALCQGAVFDRFPRLKVLLLETGGGWIAHFLERMDAKHKLLSWKTGLKHYPSEYFKRQCWISFDPDETTIPAMVKHCGADRFIWASDFPHFDASPAAVEETKAAISSLTPSEQQLILGDNVAHIYQLS
jgi:predicted TIM-barrel fold metal-dependent hydrolase